MDIQRKAFESSNNVNPDWSFKFDEELQQYVATDFEMTNQVDEFNEHWDTFRAGWETKAQAVPEWINVHLLSPQIDTEVLICVDDDVQLAVWRVDDCGGYFEDAIGEIKWWMPLPKAQEPTND
ncbi:hypothetical protein NI465_01125 [Acinetobacter lwoffii]|uniref:hypothetical protein n=1 Tax=Acinetobacter lwoffii TaxID=28090 RepID=UPI00209A6CF4|nr:hypothetical protein [Acinetobacter lwoffii]MCO8112807.1 hypothetical protein [Acinetobacter lwoffii]